MVEEKNACTIEKHDEHIKTFFLQLLNMSISTCGHI